MLLIIKPVARTLRRALVRIAKPVLRTFRRALIAEQTMAHLETIRAHELDVVTALLPTHGKLLEIGSGTGWQAQALATLGYDVSAVDLPSSNYAEYRVFDVLEYDGHTLPFGTQAFDIIYSSNLLEHIPHLAVFQFEIHRTLRPDGCVIHVLPSSSWRFWTNLTHIVRWWTWPQRHGEHASNAFDEIRHFSKQTWCRHFLDSGWIVTAVHHNGLFYTGNSILDSRLNMKMRRVLSRVLGNSCNIFVLKKQADA